MTSAHCVVTRRRDRTAAVTRFEIIGDANGAATRALHRAIHGEFRRSKGVTLIVDLSRTDSMASECVQVLLHAYTRALQSGNGFAVVNVQGPMRTDFAAVGLCSAPWQQTSAEAFEVLLSAPDEATAAAPASTDHDDHWLDELGILLLKQEHTPAPAG